MLIAVQAPLGVLLTPGIELGVDKGKATAYPFHHCRPEGCLAIFPVSQQLRKNLESGNRANIDYSLINGKKYGIPVSLKGITAGLRALKNAAADAKKSGSG